MNTVLEAMVTRMSVCFADIGKTQVLKIFRFENKVLCLIENSAMSVGELH